MSYRLINQRNPEKILELKNWAWYRLLDMAETHGWIPMGTVFEDSLYGHILTNGNYQQYQKSFDDFPFGDGYTGEGIRLVLVEDALNLGDALERVYIDYEPIYSYEHLGSYLPVGYAPANSYTPGVGVIDEAANFCFNGAFYISSRSNL